MRVARLNIEELLRAQFGDYGCNFRPNAIVPIVPLRKCSCGNQAGNASDPFTTHEVLAAMNMLKTFSEWSG
jgi:hypothetical protein